MEFLSSEEITQDLASTIKRVRESAETIEIRASEDNDSVYLISAKDYQLFQKLLKQTQENQPEEKLDCSNYELTQTNIDFDSFFADLEV